MYPDDEICITIIRLDKHDSEIEVLYSLLDAEELARCSRLRFDNLKRRFIVSHGYTRKLLSSYLGIEPNSILFGFGPFGKPAVAFPRTDVHFNLTHSGEIAALAVARCEVGIDVEQVRPIPDVLSIARQFLRTAEAAEIERLPETERPAGFLQTWTRNEAYAKCFGEGLGLPFDSLCVSEKGPGLLEITRNGSESTRCFLQAFEPGTGYVGALAHRGPMRRLIRMS